SIPPFTFWIAAPTYGCAPLSGVPLSTPIAEPAPQRAARATAAKARPRMVGGSAHRSRRSSLERVNLRDAVDEALSGGRIEPLGVGVAVAVRIACRERVLGDHRVGAAQQIRSAGVALAGARVGRDLDELVADRGELHGRDLP